jgi:hypothetical protein
MSVWPYHPLIRRKIKRNKEKGEGRRKMGEGKKGEGRREKGEWLATTEIEKCIHVIDSR